VPAMLWRTVTGDSRAAGPGRGAPSRKREPRDPGPTAAGGAEAAGVTRTAFKFRVGTAGGDSESGGLAAGPSRTPSLSRTGAAARLAKLPLY
jgi:hypothetical protein